MSSRQSLVRNNAWADENLICFVTDSTSSVRGAGDGLHKSQQSKSRTSSGSAHNASPSFCSQFSRLSPSSTSSSTCSHIQNQTFDAETTMQRGPTPPDLCHEMNIAKSILQQYSTISGSNLYDHLSDIIKRVIDERPPNVIDFFEEFSRNVREQKFYLPDRFPPKIPYEETRLYKVAKQQLKSMKLPYEDYGDAEQKAEEIPAEEAKTDSTELEKLELFRRPVLNIFNARIQKLQFYWNQCGFSISNDDTFLLASSLERLRTHPSILQCRFWGVINGINASYYIVEAVLTKEVKGKRLQQMEEELWAHFEKQLQKEREDPDIPAHVGPELTPGCYGWERFDKKLCDNMLPRAERIPLPRPDEIYDVPPEMFGVGLNRFSYFVVNNLADDWFELPIVTPKQIAISRQIKKFFTGNLEAEIVSYPSFPGQEKHYLRAMIARITCSTTIAPRGFYRKMTKAERFLYEGGEEDEAEEENFEDEIRSSDDETENEIEEEEDYTVIDNDVLLVRNEKYKNVALEDLAQLSKWVHVRPAVLKQGRVVWFDDVRARREREKELKRLRKETAKSSQEEFEDEEQQTEDEDEEEIDEEDSVQDRKEYGPTIFSRCSNDSSDEYTVPWIARYTSEFTDKPESILVMRSNIWPGSYTFTTDELCETVYMGWGHKYVSRNLPFVHLPNIVGEYPHNNDDFIETTDPSVADEKAYLAYLQQKGTKRVSFADEEENEEEATDTVGGNI